LRQFGYSYVVWALGGSAASTTEMTDAVLGELQRLNEV
jgi:hypothetical protein